VTEGELFYFRTEAHNIFKINWYKIQRNFNEKCLKDYTRKPELLNVLERDPHLSYDINLDKINYSLGDADRYIE
jgi:hypothetical protein